MMNSGFKDATAVSMGAWPSDLINGERTVPPLPRHDPLKQVGGETYYVPMEVCETIFKHWFWVPDDPPKSVRSLYRLYRNSVGRGANLLLNVPPDKTGTTPRYHVDALMELKNAIDDPSTLPPPPLTFDKKATASNAYQGMARHGAGQAIDDDPSTRWATDSGITAATLEVDLGRAMIFSRAMIMEAYPELKRVRAFQIEYRQGDSWKTCYTGTRIGLELDVTFEPVTARQVRLNITESTDGPTIWEFQLYGR